MRTRLPAAPLLAAVDATVGRPRPGWTTRLRRSVGESGVRAYERAQREKIPGRSKMDREELAAALRDGDES